MICFRYSSGDLASFSRNIPSGVGLPTLQSDPMLLVCMVFQMSQVSDGNACGFAFRMRTTYCTTPLQRTDMILDMSSECILLTEDPCAVLECEPIIPKAEEALQVLASHGNSFAGSRRYWLVGRSFRETIVTPDRFPP